MPPELIKCPKCQSANIQTYDNQSLEHHAQRLDDEIYASAQCLEVDCEAKFSLYGKISWEQPLGV